MKKRVRSCNECQVQKAVDKLITSLVDKHYKDAEFDKSRLDSMTAIRLLVGNTVRVYIKPESVTSTIVSYPKKMDQELYELLYTLLEMDE